jgi:hypothetical protein
VSMIGGRHKNHIPSVRKMAYDHLCTVLATYEVR